MINALWTAASGMDAQQRKVDTIANNLANAGTTGYKKQRVEFKDLLYETTLKAGIDKNGNGRPVNLQVGHGVKTIATVKDYTIGNIEDTSNKYDFAVNGTGFFVVRKSSGQEAYTKDGSFKINNIDGDTYIVTSEGDKIIGEDDEPVKIPQGTDLSRVNVATDGNFTYTDDTGKTIDLGIKFKLVQFDNPNGLENEGENFYKSTSASGQPISESDLEEPKKSAIMQGFLESSNVKVVEEMVNLIVAQRAYELNSKSIQAADDMLSQANQLKRS